MISLVCHSSQIFTNDMTQATCQSTYKLRLMKKWSNITKEVSVLTIKRIAL